MSENDIRACAELLTRSLSVECPNTHGRAGVQRTPVSELCTRRRGFQASVALGADGDTAMKTNRHPPSLRWEWGRSGTTRRTGKTVLFEPRPGRLCLQQQTGTRAEHRVGTLLRSMHAGRLAGWTNGGSACVGWQNPVVNRVAVHGRGGPWFWGTQ